MFFAQIPSLFSCVFRLRVACIDTCYDKGAPLFSEVPRFWSSRPLPKTDLEKNETSSLAPDEKFHGLGKRRESRNKRPISDDFGLRSPVIQETISNEKCYLYCSMRQSARSWRTLAIGSLSDDPVRRSLYDLRGQTQATVNEVLIESTRSRREELRINEGKVMLATPSRY